MTWPVTEHSNLVVSFLFQRGQPQLTGDEQPNHFFFILNTTDCHVSIFAKKGYKTEGTTLKVHPEDKQNFLRIIISYTKFMNHSPTGREYTMALFKTNRHLVLSIFFVFLQTYVVYYLPRYLFC